MHILNAALLFLRDFFPMTLIKLSTGLLGKFLANGVGGGYRDKNLISNFCMSGSFYFFTAVFSCATETSVNLELLTHRRRVWVSREMCKLPRRLKMSAC